MRSDVAVLYVDPRGPYPKLVSDWYDEQRDATTYAGALPVVAHPPCGPWGALRHLNKFQDQRHALHAVPLVRRVGGAIEHPANSALWPAVGLPRPNALPDTFGGWTLEIDQCRFGHPCRKMTWVYIVGCAREDLPPIPPPREPTHWFGGGRNRGDGRTPIPPGIKAASSQMGRRTPPAFAAWLIEVASRCRR